MSGTTSFGKSFDLSPRTWAGVVIVLLVVFFLALNIFSNVSFRSARLDLTEKGLFSLSKGTVNILRNLKEPIRIQVFYSEKIGVDYPQIRTYAERVRDLLGEYAARSGGKVKLEYVDPEPFSDAEDLAATYGLHGAQTQSGEMLYFGLVGTNAIDGQEVIPFFPQDRAPYLEYDLTEIIYKLDNPEKPVLGVITSLPLSTGPGGPMAMMQGRSRPYLIYEQMRDRFEVKTLGDNIDAVPADVDVLMIAHPGALSEKTQYAIDQFVLGGGRALVFVDPNSEMAGPGMGPMGQPTGTSPQSDLKRLFPAWGIQYDPTKVVGDLQAAQTVTATIGGRQVRASYPVWLGLTQINFDRDDLVTGQIQQLNMATPGFLKPAENATTIFTPLVKTSSDSMLYGHTEVMGQPNPEDLLRKFVPSAESYVIGARVTGPVKTAFPDGPPKSEDEGKKDADNEDTGKKDAGKKDGDAKPDAEADAKTAEDAKPVPLKESVGPVNIIVVADTDLFDDRFWVVEQNLFGQRIAVPQADNANFVLSAIENLMGSNDLISLRSRASGERPFTVVEDLRKHAESRFLEREQALQHQLEAAEQQLSALQGKREGEEQASGAFLTPEERALAEKVRGQMITTRKELRDVQHSLRADIERLGNWLIFWNVVFVPLVVIGFALWLAVRRRRRRARHVSGVGG